MAPASPLFDAFARYPGDQDREVVRQALQAHARDVAREPRGDRSLVARVEAEVERDPSVCFAFDSRGHATLRAANRTFQAGRFETPTLGKLRARALEARRSKQTDARLRLFVLDGATPATDIGALQAVAPHGALFQVASQFNCLESPSARIVPVADYLHDGTQGPRASISAFPGTLLRHYAAPGEGARFVQSHDGRQINLLGAVCTPEVATVRSGYLTSRTIARPDLLARALEDRFDELAVGFHEDVEVVFGHDWLGPVARAPHHRISHLLTSTLAAGGYGALSGGDSTSMMTIIRQLQRAAYEGTLLAAAASGTSHAVLTLIGGGVFGNPVEVIWDAILWAADRVQPLLHEDLCVVVNGYSIGARVPMDRLNRGAADRGGLVATFTPDGVNV